MRALRMKKIWKFGLAVLLTVWTMAPVYAQEDRLSTQSSPKSPGTALAWSLWGTVIPNVVGTALQLSTTEDWTEITGASLANAGTVLGPSLGYFYGGIPGRAWRGNAIRGGLTGVFLVAALKADDNDGDAEAGIASLTALVILVHAIVDIAQVDGAVRQKNEKMLNASLILTPKYFAGQKAGGLELQVRF